MKYLFLFVAFISSQVVLAQSKPFEAVVQYYHQNKQFNGAVLVANQGKIEYLSAVGLANRQAASVVTPQTKFKIASISKTFTAVLVLQLYQQGKIALHVPFGKYYPGYKGEAKHKVTIAHLLTYSSGIHNALGEQGMRPYQLPLSLDAFIDTYCSGKLAFGPGTQSNYSNTDYIILHKIIENVTQKSFAALLHENILRPLQMQNTGMLAARDVVPGLASSYTISDASQELGADEPYFIENYFGAGAMYSTVEDLLRFNNALFANRLLDSATTQLMLQPNEKLGGVAFGLWYAAGYGTFSKPFMYRTGGILGATANWIHTLDDQKTILLLNNTNGTNLYEFSEQLYLVSTGQQPSLAMVPDSSADREALQLARVKGTWVLDLRADPTSAPYFKDFVLTPTGGKSFDGEFYGTAFTNGYFNTDWDKLYFAFTTADKEHVYYHAGYIENDRIYGISYSEGRQFTSHWTGVKK